MQKPQPLDSGGFGRLRRRGGACRGAGLQPLHRFGGQMVDDGFDVVA